jgi:tetratricopeptide (TPR) repeat protein
MPDNQRIEDLRRRVQKDPASIAFAQLAEECRRAEQYQEAIDTCRAGLELHPGYLSARVTLGRALIEIDHLDEAQTELELVLSSAPENLAAIRGLAEIFHRRGSLAQALKQYRAALALARNDPDLERTVTELAREIEPKPATPVIDGLSFEEMASEFMAFAPPPPPPAPPRPPESEAALEAAPSPQLSSEPASAAQGPPVPPDETPMAAPEELQSDRSSDPPSESPSESPLEASPDDSALTRAQACHAEAESGVEERRRATIAALDQMLDAIHVARDQHRP